MTHKLKQGLVQCYIGSGKGKTSASIGALVRALGFDFKILFIQFFKEDKVESGEKTIIRERFPEVDYIRTNVKHPFFTQDKTDKDILIKSIKDTYQGLKEKTMSGIYDMVILDEIIDAVEGKWIDEKDFCSFLKNKPTHVEIIITGHYNIKSITDVCDYVSEINALKHPYEQNIKARKGIEY